VERQFNSAGDRNFNIVLDPETAELMKQDGWNIRQLRSLDEETPGDFVIQVTVNYDKGRPPRCVMITGDTKTELGAGEVALLDAADIAKADVLLSGYEWEVNGKSGVKAYLSSIFVTVVQDPLEVKYAHIGQRPDSDLVSVGSTDDPPF
jgi:hypothetical protein